MTDDRARNIDPLTPAQEKLISDAIDRAHRKSWRWRLKLFGKRIRRGKEVAENRRG